MKLAADLTYYDLKSDIQLVNLMYTKEYSGAKSDVALLGRKIGREIFGFWSIRC